MVRIKTVPMTPIAVTENTEPKLKKKYRFKNGTVTLRNIKKLQNSTTLLLQKAPFNKVVREITRDLNPKMLYQKRAIEALQEAAESFMIDAFKKANTHALHAKRKTIAVEDMQMAV